MHESESVARNISQPTQNGDAALLAFDWQRVGLPRFKDWDPALICSARLSARAVVPMTLLIGPKAILVPNAAAMTLFGERTGSTLTDAQTCDPPSRSEAAYARVLARAAVGESIDVRDQPIRIYRRGEWSTAWFNLHFTPVTNATETVLAVLVTASEVTHHIHRIRRASEAEQRLRFALDASGMVGIWDFDIATNVSTSDANVARIYGLSAAETERGVDDRLFFRAIHPDDRERVGETFRSAIAARTPYRCLYRVIPEDGRLRWVIASGKPSYDEDDSFARFLGVIVDVTDQMETKTALAESRFQFETLTEALPQIVWSCDAEGRHDYFSARWSEFTGISQDGITEETWKQLVYPDHWDEVSRLWGESLRTGKPYDVDYRFRHSSGEFRWLRVMALPIHDDRGRITRWFGTSTDVHESYLIADERARLAEELERMATIDPLTDILTRRAFVDRAETAIDQAAVQAEPVSLLMLDIDHFKAINDTYGHPSGDRVLAVAAKRIKSALKQFDIVGRLGGEEFAVLMRGCDLEQARDAADRICRGVADEPIILDGGLEISVALSIGGTTKTAPQQDLDFLLFVADKALYRAKASGRNRSEFGTDAVAGSGE